jgi:hypothetical protein
LSNVSSETLDKIMGKEEREKYLPELRQAVAEKHILARRQQQLRVDVHENEKKVKALDLLSGGLAVPPFTDRNLTWWDFEKQVLVHLRANYSHPTVSEGNYSREFARAIHQKRPYTDAIMDQHAEATVDLIEYHTQPDAASFWLWAVYAGNYEEMIDTLAEELGFVKNEKKV